MVVTSCIDIAGISCLWLLPSRTGCRTGRGTYWRLVVLYHHLMDGWDFVRDWEDEIILQSYRIDRFTTDDWKLFFSRDRLLLASGKFYDLRKRMYDVSLYRHTARIYSGSRWKISIFVRETSRYLALNHSFCFLGANDCNRFYDCSSFGSLGEVFAHGGEFPLSFLVVVS